MIKSLVKKLSVLELQPGTGIKIIGLCFNWKFML